MNPIRVYDSAVARLTRRELLKIAGTVGLAVIARPVVSAQTMARPLFRSYPFALGVASGDPMPDGVVLWTRLAPEPLEGGGMPMSNVEVVWEIAADSRFSKVAQRGTAIARPELGHSVHVEATGLEPARDYWYRFRAGDEVSQTGRTRTAPAAGAAVDRLRFGVCGCSHYETGYFSAYRRIAEEHFDFVFHTGDYIYEGRADGGRNPSLVRQHRGHELYSVVDYRNRYAQYKSDPDLMAAHASAPFIVTYDDHEVDNDYAGNQDENGTPSEVFALRRAAAYQAYYETMPLRRASLPNGSSLRLYRRLQFGSLIDFSVLDTRQYRSKQACGGGSKPACPEALDPNRTILGAEQEKWLFENLSSVRGTWTVMGQQVPTFGRDLRQFDPAGRFAMDKWDGYVASRNRLYEKLKETRAPNPIVLSGDVHQHFGSDLKLDFSRPDSETIGAEFTNTSITAGGDGTDVSASYERSVPDNPHIKYHSARRGYIACTATPAAMRADFKIFDRVSVPNQPAKTGGSLIVEPGRPGAGSI
jgi:alkaline phosphatase D